VVVTPTVTVRVTEERAPALPPTAPRDEAAARRQSEEALRLAERIGRENERIRAEAEQARRLAAEAVRGKEQAEQALRLARAQAATEAVREQARIVLEQRRAEAANALRVAADLERQARERAAAEARARQVAQQQVAGLRNIQRGDAQRVISDAQRQADNLRPQLDAALQAAIRQKDYAEGVYARWQAATDPVQREALRQEWKSANQEEVRLANEYNRLLADYQQAQAAVTTDQAKLRTLEQQWARLAL